MKKRIVIALGGNAIKQPHELGTAQEQMKNIKNSCQQILQIIQAGYEVVLTHGNGPQIGNLLIQQETGIPQVPVQPMDICGAMTQGQIGYMVQQTLVNGLKTYNLNLNVVTVITQVLVNREDPDFRSPSKPIGPFYDQETGKRNQSEKGYQIKQVLPNGEKPFRRVVPSPDPIRILEGKALKRLVDAGMIVIASGGGGIPVTLNDRGELEGVEGVIDKDLAGEKLAEAVGADILMILTDVNKVKLGFGTPEEKDLDKIDVNQAKRYLKEGHFLPGSMAPKISACLRFIEYGGEKAIIASLDKSWEAIQGQEGTHIIP
ncbi:MAG: carbamate kinase [Deltaproteobacteria bacterium]|nr:carbamate kinase [Deltaproteobacteria bacterium]